MIGKGELVKNRKAPNGVRAVHLQDVGVQGDGIAGDVEDIVKMLKQFHTLVVQTRPRGVNLHSFRVKY